MQLSNSESRSPFSRPDRKHARHATATNPPREAAASPTLGRHGRTVLRQTPRGVPKRPKDGPAQPAIRSRKDGETLPPVETTTTTAPCMAGRTRQERQGTRPTETKTDRYTTAYESPGTPCLRRRGSWNTRTSNPSRPWIRTGARPKASDRLRLNRAARL